MRSGHRAIQAAVFGLSLLVSACAPATGPSAPPSTPQANPFPDTIRDDGALRSDRAAVDLLTTVARRVGPVAEQECRARTRGVDCDLTVVIEENTDLPPNAFQTLTDDGEPLIVFTLALVREVRNEDELAFVLGHEAAHHIQGHIPQSRQTAAAGSLLAGLLTQWIGGSQDAVQTAQDIGAGVGSRAFSKEFELEADALGTVIAARAGYDPVLGALFFNRLPDPGNVFLGTHPPNAERIQVVRQTAARLGLN